jgi:hypothetical protein
LTKQARGTEIVVQDEEGPLSFRGETLADLSWTYQVAEERGHTRWTDMALHRVLEPGSPWKYVIQIVGRSVMYHRSDGPCSRGVNMAVGLLREDEPRYEALVICPRPGCQPKDLEDMGDHEVVSVEEDIYTLFKCRSGADVVQTLQNRGGNRDNVSPLSVRLLQAASRVDREISMALAGTRRL